MWRARESIRIAKMHDGTAHRISPHRPRHTNAALKVRRVRTSPSAEHLREIGTCDAHIAHPYGTCSLIAPSVPCAAALTTHRTTAAKGEHATTDQVAYGVLPRPNTVVVDRAAMSRLDHVHAAHRHVTTRLACLAGPPCRPEPLGSQPFPFRHMSSTASAAGCAHKSRAGPTAL